MSALTAIRYVYDIPETSDKTIRAAPRRRFRYSKPRVLGYAEHPVTLADLLDLEALSALASVVIIDVTLAGDNAVVVGLAAASLPRQQQARVILVGIVAATVLRILFAVIAVQLLAIIGLTLAGGILLLWVAWKMSRELTHRPASEEATATAPPSKRFSRVLVRVIIAD